MIRSIDFLEFTECHVKKNIWAPRTQNDARAQIFLFLALTFLAPPTGRSKLFLSVVFFFWRACYFFECGGAQILCANTFCEKYLSALSAQIFLCAQTLYCLRAACVALRAPLGIGARGFLLLEKNRC